jgi:parallel beta-helix repeat protein
MLRAITWCRRHPGNSMLRLVFLITVSATLAAILSRSDCWAKVINVPGDEPTIQAGIDAASNGDTILVAPGVYNENITFDTVAAVVTVASKNGPSVTTIQGTGTGPVVQIGQGVLSGFTITGGHSEDLIYPGGGISIGGSPMIIHNIITGNVSDSSGGGGIGIYNSSPIIESNIITNNVEGTNYSGGGGGGIQITKASSARIIGNTISNNTANTSDGGGIYLNVAGTPLLMNNVISGNLTKGVFGGYFGGPAASGGGIAMINDSDPLIVQNLIIKNTADLGGGVSFDVPSTSIGPLLVNDTIAGNTTTQGLGSAIFRGRF